VIGRAEQEPAAAVGRDIGHRVGERPVAEVFQPAGRGIDREARRNLRLAAEAGEQELLVRADRHRDRPARLGDAGHDLLLDHREIAGVRIKRMHDDLVARRVADIEVGRGAGRCRHRACRQEESARERGKTVTHGFLPRRMIALVIAAAVS
jgi:hypothetical protein